MQGMIIPPNFGSFPMQMQQHMPYQQQMMLGPMNSQQMMMMPQPLMNDPKFVQQQQMFN